MPRMRTASLRLAALVVLAAPSVSACGPSIDRAAQVDIDRRVAALVPSGHAFPAPTGLSPKPLAIGQWTLHRLTNDKGEPSLVTYKIVGADAGAYWVEVASESYYGKTVTKMLLAVGDRANPNTMELRALKLKDAKGKVTELQGPAIQLTKSTWRKTAGMLAVSWQGLPQEPASSIAGDFAACFKARTDASWGGWHTAATVWMHPLVPINSLVKSVGIDRPSTMELIGFGDEGAQSEIPDAATGSR